MDAKKIIISRTDGIGDVILALPVAGVLKKLYPANKVIFLGRTYTKPVIDACAHIDEFVAWDEPETSDMQGYADKLRKTGADIIIHAFPRKEVALAAKKAKIPIRIGTYSRLYHWGRCNRLIKLSRKKSAFHEAQLNLKLLVSLGAKKLYELNEIKNFYGFTKIRPLDDGFKKFIDKTKFNLIIHPHTKGSAREWGLENYKRLIELLPKEKFRIFISGTENEGQKSRPFLSDNNSEVVDLTGKFTLNEFISFISEIDGVLAASTGPLHIAAALGKYAVGLYAPMHPIHPGRWAPLGEKASYIVKDLQCSKCRYSDKCECIESISPEEVFEKFKILMHSKA